MKRVVVVVALFLGACGVPVHHAGRTLHDGPMLRPPPAAEFDPTTDSPNPFEAPPPRSRIQPQPVPERVLPETPETRKGPGLWATKAPMDEPIEFDWDVPMPAKDDEAATRIRQCAEIMKHKTAKVLTPYDAKEYDKINANWRNCWPVAAANLCVDHLLSEASFNALVNPTAKREAEVLKRALESLDPHVASRCGGGELFSPGVRGKLNDTWRAR